MRFAIETLLPVAGSRPSPFVCDMCCLRHLSVLLLRLLFSFGFLLASLFPIALASSSPPPLKALLSLSYLRSSLSSPDPSVFTHVPWMFQADYSRLPFFIIVVLVVVSFLLLPIAFRFPGSLDYRVLRSSIPLSLFTGRRKLMIVQWDLGSSSIFMIFGLFGHYCSKTQ